MSVQPGDMRNKLTFSVRSTGSGSADNYGNDEGAFVDQFSTWAKLLPIKGFRANEDIMAARLQGHQPYIVTVRRNSDTVRITTDWRAVDPDQPTLVFNVRSVSPTPDLDALDLLCETGVAV